MLWYIAHPFCEVSVLSAYTASLSAFTFLVCLFGLLVLSKWIKRVAYRKTGQQFRVQLIHCEPEFLSDESHSVSVFVVYDFDNNEVGDWVDHHLCQA